MTDVLRPQALSGPLAPPAGPHDSGLYIAADDAEVVVNSNLTAFDGPALHVVGDRADIDAFGNLTSPYSAALMTDGDDISIRIRMDARVSGLNGVFTTGKDTSITVEGGILAEMTAIQVTGADDDIADRLWVDTSGVIEAGQTGISVGPSDGRDMLVLKNSGGIIRVEDPESGLSGDAVLGGSAGDFVRNSGQIYDNVSLGDGDDIYRGASGSLDGMIDGGLGNDTIGGGDEDNRIEGGGGADVICGNDGADSLSSGWGNDRVFGGLGGDTIGAGAGADVVWGVRDST